MKRSIYIRIMIIVVMVWVFAGGRYLYRQIYGYSGKMRTSDSGTTDRQNQTGILTEDNITDAGDHIVVYRTGLQKKDWYFKGEYIALRDLDAYQTAYLPDIYGEIMEIRVEDLSRVYIRYRTSQDEPVQEITIPLCFEGKEGNGLDLDLSIKGKVVTQLQGDKGSLVQDLPMKIWSEDIRWDGKSYEVLFERTSPIYEPVGGVTGGFFADYCLTVQDGEGNAISRQTIADYPVAYEEMYWLIDYSQDGFSDIVFCTDHYQGKNSYTHLHFLHWNTEKNLYEPDPLVGPDGRYMGISYEAYLWNPMLSAVVLFSGGDEWGNLSLEMYSFTDGAWNRIRRLEPVYEENVCNEDRKPAVRCFKEIIYEGNEAVEENMTEDRKQDHYVSAPWHDEDSIWSRYNQQNIKLYPNVEKWDEIETGIMISDKPVRKYVRKPDSIRMEKTSAGSEQDMTAYEISRRNDDTVDVIIDSQEGYEEFIRVLPEFQDCSVLWMDLKGNDTSLYMDEILAYRNFDHLYIENGGNIQAKDIEKFHDDTLVHMSLDNITGMEEGILSRITKRKSVHICTDSRYRGTFPAQEILNDTVSENLTVITESDMGQMDVEGADTKAIKEWEYFKDIPEKEGRYLARIYRVNAGEYCYTGYEFCVPDIRDDRPHVFLCVKDKASGGKAFLEILEFPEEGIPQMNPTDGTRISLEDVNFDGYQDIIYMGGNNGWELYRQNVGILWNEEKKQYEIEKSFPEYVRFVDAERKRLTWIAASGNYEEYYIYEYVDGVYEEKRLEVTYPWQNENGVVWDYYENDNLINRMIWNNTDPKDTYCTLYDGEGNVIEERIIEGENWYYSGIGQMFFPEFDFYYNG